MATTRMLAVDGEAVAVRIRAYRSSRRLRLTVEPGGDVRLSVPARTSQAAVDEFLERTRPWLERTLATQRARSSALGLLQPGTVPLGGGSVPLRWTPAGRPAARRAPDGGAIEAFGDPEAAAGAVERLLRRLARERVETTSAVWSARLAVEPAAFRIGDQRSRWGSASTSGVLSFSWRLVLAPPSVLEYVVVHELCHLREPNHSPAFWALVADALPGHRAERGWLGEHGGELRRWNARDALAQPSGSTAATALVPRGVVNATVSRPSSRPSRRSSSSPRSSGSR